MIDNNDPIPGRHGFDIGTVVHRNDPLGRGRVRVRVPGVMEPAGPWAWPLGAPGGGAADRGAWWIPELGAEVAVLYKGGDTQFPYYMPAQWRAPGGASEVPVASDGGDPDVRVLAFGAYDLVVDTRGGSKSFRVVDKAAGDNVIEMDGSTRAIRISSTVAIQIESTGTVEINGLVVTINGIPAGLGRL